MLSSSDYTAITLKMCSLATLIPADGGTNNKLSRNCLNAIMGFIIVLLTYFFIAIQIMSTSHTTAQSSNTFSESMLNRKSDIVLRVGKICLASGTGSYRVKQSMAKVAHMLGVVNQAHVTLTEIDSTCRQGNQFKTEVCTLYSVGVNNHRIQQIETLIIDLEANPTQWFKPNFLDELDHQLSRIEQQPGLYRPLMSGLFSAIACSSFTFLVGGGFMEMLGVFFAAGLGHLVRRLLMDKHLNHFFATMVAAAVAAALYFLIFSVIKHVYGINSQHEAGYIASMLFLIPGFPLITGVLDLAKLDFSSGIQRIGYAVAIIFCATFSAWLVAVCVNMEPQPLLTPHLNDGLLFVFRLLASFFGVLGFSLMFNSPMRTATTAAAIGMIANTLRLSSIDWWHVPPQAASLLAACLVGLLACVFSQIRHCPRIALSVPAVCIMVPGVYMFRAVYYLEQNNILNAINWSIQALLIVVALPMGLALARMFTDKEWAYTSGPSKNS